MRFGLAAALTSALALAACDSTPGSETEAQAEAVKVQLGKPAQAPAASAAAPTADNDYGATPLEERVAVLGLLNKRNNVSEDIQLKPGEAREIGPVIIRLASCERTAPWELPQETGAFVQVDIRERGESQHKRVFSGWLFRESPSLNVVEHPVYDVWVKDCTMRFPGEEGPASGATPSPAPEARPTAAPATTPRPMPSPAPDA